MVSTPPFYPSVPETPNLNLRKTEMKTVDSDQIRRSSFAAPSSIHFDRTLHAYFGVSGYVARKLECSRFGECPDDLLRLADAKRDRVTCRLVQRRMFGRRRVHSHLGHVRHHLTSEFLIGAIADRELVWLFTFVGDDEADGFSGTDLQCCHVEHDFRCLDADRPGGF